MKTVKAFFGLSLFLTACLCAYGLFQLPGAAPKLKVTFSPNGLQQLTFNGIVLEDLERDPADAFHIWHMKMTDLQGNVVGNGQYGWGENHDSRTWDASTHTWNYGFEWGTISLQFVQNGNNLDMNVTESNNANSNVVLDGAVIYPMVLHFPKVPASFGDQGYSQLSYNVTAPSVMVADYGSGQVTAVAPDASKPLYSGFQPASAGPAYTPIVSGTAPDGLADFLPHVDRPVAPGQTEKFTVSLRFSPSGTATRMIAGDAYKNWTTKWPPQIRWKDRRAIGTVYLASSPSGNVNQPGGYPNNPRRYFNEANPDAFNISTPSGLALFQKRILRQADDNVTNLKRMHAQGAITWDIEGEQYPQDTSYVCQPDTIAQAAPEMESIITDTTSAYAGMKLDDAYFKIMRNAGFRVGVCIRPQHFTLYPNGTAGQVFLSTANVAAELLRKMKYAHDRWGATLFYIDSTVEPDGAVLSADIFKTVAAALPDSLLIPEETTPKHFAYTAPFASFIFHRDLGTDLNTYNFYPNAFSANLINDVDPSVLASSQAPLTESVRRGDILMGHVDYWHPNNNTIVQMYLDAQAAAKP